MGNGLKRVAKICGGITVKSKDETVRYNADSELHGDCWEEIDYPIRIRSRFSRSAQGWVATIFFGYTADGSRCRDNLSESGVSVLGVYATPEAANEAARTMIELRRCERVCTGEDIDEVRNRKG